MIWTWLVVLALLSGGDNGDATPASTSSQPALHAASTPSKPSAFSASASPTTASEWRIDGIALGDEEGDVKNGWGSPARVTKDEWAPGCETWRYKDGRNVEMCEGSVASVQLTPAAKTVDLNGKRVAVNPDSLRTVLGKPGFAADDGWGVEKGEEAIKVFTDEHGKLVSVDLFFGPCGV